MTKAFIITEGKSDIEILKALLPAHSLVDVECISGTERSSAISLARTILLSDRIPVALILDADTTNRSAIRQENAFLQMSLAEVSYGIQYAFFLAVPEIEIVFLEDWDFVGQQIGKQKQEFTHFELEYAQLQPRKFLFSQLEDMPYPEALTQLLARMDERTIERIRQNPLVRDLNAFLLSVLEKGPEHSRPLPAVHTLAA